MAKTFAPQLVRLLRHIRLYINKHGSTLQGALSSSEWTACQTIVTAIGVFDAEKVQEAP